MKPSRIFPIAALAILAVAAFMTPGSAQPAPKATPTPVGVCDIAAVFNQYERAKDLSDRFAQKRQALVAEAKKRSDAVRQMGKALESLAPGSKAYEAKLIEIETKTVELTNWRQLQGRINDRQYFLLTQQMYNEIVRTLGAVAKQRRCQVVIQLENLDVRPKNVNEFMAMMSQRKCLYHDGAVDLTQTVLDRLNRQYRTKKP